MLRAYKYRIYPNKEQEDQINHAMNVARLVYNLALETKVRCYKECGVNLSKYDLYKQYTQLRLDYEWISNVSYDFCQAAIDNMDKAFKVFFNKGGFPKFKSRRSLISLCSKSKTGCKRIYFEKGLISVGRIKNIKTKVSQSFSGNIKRCYIKKTTTGKYFASFLVDCDIPKVPICDDPENIGIDLGIKHFAVLSNGKKIDSHKYLENGLKRLAVLQKQLSRKQKGGKNRLKSVKKVALKHEKIRNQRQDFTQKLSNKLTTDSQVGVICIENLRIGNMIKNRNLSRAISNAGWGEFIRQIEYKSSWYGRRVFKVSTFYPSSKTCSACGNINKGLSLSVREWTCECGAVHDRDINAAINIRNAGIGNPGGPVESSAIAETLKQEAKTSIPKTMSNNLQTPHDQRTKQIINFIMYGRVNA